MQSPQNSCQWIVEMSKNTKVAGNLNAATIADSKNVQLRTGKPQRMFKKRSYNNILLNFHSWVMCILNIH